jgi:lysyl-tRNA synthetase class II
MVIVKQVLGPRFVTYVIADKNDPDRTFKVFSKKGDYLRLDCMTFDEMHEDVEVGDYVSLVGKPACSLNGNLYINISRISVISYGNNKYELESDDEEELIDTDDEYVPEDESDEESDYETAVEEEESEDEADEDEMTAELEKVSSDYYPAKKELDGECFEIPEVPMKVYNDFIEYRGHTYKLKAVRCNVPGKITLATKIGNFEFAKLDRKMMGVYVPANTLELNYSQGYDLIIREKFRDLLEVVY